MSTPVAARRPTKAELRRLEHWLGREHHLIGASLLRIGIGGLVLTQLLWQWDQRAFLRGAEGMYPTWLFVRELPAQHAPSLFAVESPLLFDLLYLLTMVVAGLFLLGWRSRWVGIWLYILVWSLFHRNPMLITGGEKLFLAVLPYVLLLNTSAYFSMDRWRMPAAGQGPRVSALLHNAGVASIMAQLSLTYGAAGLAKLAGDRWRDGTAAALALRVPEFNMLGMGELLAGQPLLTAGITYGTLAFELGFPFLVWSTRTRWLAQAAAVLFHLAIGLTMGLVLFAAQALVVQLVVTSDRWYRALGTAASGPRRRFH